MKVRGALAGNGGMMAVTQQKQQELRTDNASETTGRTTEPKVVQRARRGRPTRKNGAEQMRQAADRRVGRISEQLADLLEGKALKGDLNSAKVLFGLAERKKPIPEPVKKRRGPSQAERWAAEPQWQEEEGTVDSEQWAVRS
jgi:hypothetical protein